MKKVLGYSEKEYMIYRKKHAKQAQKNPQKTLYIQLCICHG
jgi:hypothetical protein